MQKKSPRREFICNFLSWVGELQYQQGTDKERKRETGTQENDTARLLAN